MIKTGTTPTKPLLIVNNLLTAVGQHKQLQPVQGKDFKTRKPSYGRLTETQAIQQVYWVEKLSWKIRAGTEHGSLPTALAKHSQTPRF